MDEKKKILEMVGNNNISAEEGAKLLAALEISPHKKASSPARRIHFEIKQNNREKPLLNLAIPLKLAKLGINFFPHQAKFKANLQNRDFDFSQIDWQEIMAMAADGEVGELFYLEVDEDDGETITIRVYLD
ncbi:MAG: hypothetical protein R6U84_04785 [Candidatus Cloacimonadales bacterium]